jgi:hypothetical protein
MRKRTSDHRPPTANRLPQTANRSPLTAHRLPLGGRITAHPILTFAPGTEVEFSFEDEVLRGVEGEPIAAALVAGGVKVFRVTEKMHRPRGFFCAVGKCSSCLMEVDGRPNVMVCMEPLKAGMKVRRQVGRGKLGQDSPQRHV